MKERSLKDEMRNALRGDRERAEARRRAEAEGPVQDAPPRPVIDLNKPVTELKRPAPRPVEQAPEPEAEPEHGKGFFARLFRR